METYVAPPVKSKESRKMDKVPIEIPDFEGKLFSAIRVVSGPIDGDMRPVKLWEDDDCARYRVNWWVRTPEGSNLIIKSMFILIRTENGDLVGTLG